MSQLYRSGVSEVLRIIDEILSDFTCHYRLTDDLDLNFEVEETNAEIDLYR